MTDLERLHARVAELEGELEECKHQNGISARETELERQLAALTLTWTTARPAVAGGYWVRHAADDEPFVEMVDEFGCVGTYRKPLEECDGWEFAGPIPMPVEVPGR